MSYAKLGMAAVGAAAAYGLSRGRGRRADGAPPLNPLTPRLYHDVPLYSWRTKKEPTGTFGFVITENISTSEPQPDGRYVISKVVKRGSGFKTRAQAKGRAIKHRKYFQSLSRGRGRRAMQGRRAPTVKWEWDGDWRTTILRTRVYAKQLLDAGRLKDTPELRRAWTDHRKLIKLVEKGERGSAARGRRAAIVTSAEEIPSAWGYVTATDSFMSGWGKARGKKNKVILPVKSLREAEVVAQNARNRSDMKYVSIRRTKPNAAERGVLWSLMNRKNAAQWYKRGGF